MLDKNALGAVCIPVHPKVGGVEVTALGKPLFHLAHFVHMSTVTLKQV